jgi:hypothetical protein
MNALEEKVLELIGEDTAAPDVFTDTDEGMAPIRESISDAIAEIVMMTGGNKRQYFLPLREGIGFYRLRLENGDLGWITDVWSVTQKWRLAQTDLVQLSHYDPRWMITSGNPDTYLPLGKDIIGFYPKPSASANVMELTLVEIPSAYESGEDRVKLRESFRYAVVNYAVAEYWASRGDAGEAQKHMAMYLDALGLKQQYLPQIEQARVFQTQKEPWPRAGG